MSRYSLQTVKHRITVTIRCHMVVDTVATIVHQKVLLIARLMTIVVVVVLVAHLGLVWFDCG